MSHFPDSQGQKYRPLLINFKFHTSDSVDKIRIRSWTGSRATSQTGSWTGSQTRSQTGSRTGSQTRSWTGSRTGSQFRPQIGSRTRSRKKNFKIQKLKHFAEHITLVRVTTVSKMFYLIPVFYSSIIFSMRVQQ